MSATIHWSFLENSRNLFHYYMVLGEKAMSQISDAALLHTEHSGQNSIATIVRHMHGNMVSRWTNFLSEDGEKTWRDREGEFNNTFSGRTEVLQAWEEGWACLFTALESLAPEQLEKTIYIRNEGHTVVEAIQRQLCHYSYHCGQIVLLAKQAAGSEWQSLSIPKGGSAAYNRTKFNHPKRKKPFYK